MSNNYKICEICKKEKNVKKMRYITSALDGNIQVKKPVCKKHRCFGLINV